MLVRGVPRADRVASVSPSPVSGEVNKGKAMSDAHSSLASHLNVFSALPPACSVFTRGRASGVNPSGLMCVTHVLLELELRPDNYYVLCRD